MGLKSYFRYLFSTDITSLQDLELQISRRDDISVERNYLFENYIL